MRVLVTGTSGFIGSVLAASLANLGHTVFSVARNDRGGLHSRLIQNRFVLDLLEPIEKELIPQVDVVLHAAAKHPNSKTLLTGNLGENQTIARNLAAWVRSTNPRLLVNLSTISVHGLVEDGNLNDASGFNCPTEYGVSKLEAEAILASCSDITQVLNLRLPAVLGKNAPKHLVTNIVDKAISNADINLHSPDGTFNNVLLLDDLVSFLAKLVDNSEASEPLSLAFPIASEAPVAFRRIVSKVLDATNSKSKVTYDNFAGPNFYVDDGFARRIFGYKSRSVLEAVEFFARQRKSLYKT